MSTVSVITLTLQYVQVFFTASQKQLRLLVLHVYKREKSSSFHRIHCTITDCTNWSLCLMFIASRKTHVTHVQWWWI